MSTFIRSTISDEPTSEVVHRFQKFGEDADRALRETCSVRIEERDAPTTSFTVQEVHRRDLGDVAWLYSSPKLGAGPSEAGADRISTSDASALIPCEMMRSVISVR